MQGTLLPSNLSRVGLMLLSKRMRRCYTHNAPSELCLYVTTVTTYFHTSSLRLSVVAISVASLQSAIPPYIQAAKPTSRPFTPRHSCLRVAIPVTSLQSSKLHASIPTCPLVAQLPNSRPPTSLYLRAATPAARL